MITFLMATDRIFAWVLRVIILITSATVTIALVALVMFRVFFNYSLVGMHEVSMLAAMWLYMTGAVMASRRSEHLVVDFLATSLNSTRAKAIHSIIIAALTFVVAGFFAHWVWKMLVWGIKRPQTIPILDLPLWYAQAPFALAAVAAVVFALRDLSRAGLQIAQAGREA